MNRRLSVVFRRTSIIGLATLLLIWQTGCAVSHRGAPMTPEEAGRLKSRLGAIAVVSAEFPPKAALKTPAKGAAEGFGKGAVGGADAMLGGASGTNSAGGAIIGLLLIPVGAVVGGVGGAIIADSAKDVNQREAALKKAVSDMRIQETMRERFLKAASEKTDSILPL